MNCSFCVALQNSPLSIWFQTNAYAFGVIEALHVVGMSMVFGTIAVVDLRLLALPSTSWPVTTLSAGLVRWTWAAFVLSVVTGVLLFTSTPTLFFDNTYFRLKMLTMLCAGLNMLVFEAVTFRSVASWDKGARPPVSARLAGALSLSFWTATIVFARLIGFTKTVQVQNLDLHNIGGKFF